MVKFFVKLVSTSCLLLLPWLSHGQVTNIEDFFVDLDATKISTGYLQDKATDFVDLGRFDGTNLTDANFASIFTFRNYFLTLNSARAGSTAPVFNADAIASAMLSESTVTLNIALHEYEYLLPDALDNHKINFTGNLFQDYYEDGQWVNPYGKRYSLIFASGSLIHEGLSVTYDLGNSGAIFSNCSSVVSSIQFDAGDGLGYRSTQNLFPCTILYNSEGEKELKVKVTLTNGQVLLAHSLILIRPVTVSTLADVITFDGRQTFSLPENPDVSAVVTYKCAPPHSGTIVRPFFFVEGFDDPMLQTLTDFNGDFFNTIWNIAKLILHIPTNSFYFSDAYDIFEKCSLYPDFDFIYVDWKNPRADIRDNASLLETIIQAINEMKPTGGSAGRNVVLGHSMGGLIARYALTEMEENGVPHETDYFVSHDSPQGGANVPLGYQYAIRNLYRFIYGGSGHLGLLTDSFVKNSVDSVLGALDCYSARQMLIDYVNPSGIIDNSVHNAWMSILAAKGFPKGDPGYPIENLSTVNGGDITSVGTSLLGVSINSHSDPINSNFLIYALLGFHNLDIKMHIQKDYARGINVTSDTLRIIKPILGIPFTTKYQTNVNLAPSNHIRYDTSRGSLIADTVINKSYLYANADFPFIPEASALSADNVYTNYYLNNPRPHVDTPFDSYRLKSTAAKHMSNSNLYSWLEEQFSFSITNDEGLLLTGDTLQISRTTPWFAGGTWYTSDNNVMTVDSNSGIVSVQAPGQFVTASYEVGSDSTLHYKHKHYLAGFPDFVLFQTSPSAGRYEVTASCTDTDLNSVLDSLAASNIISFVWGESTISGGVSWCQPSYSRQYSYVGNETTIYCKIRRNRDGRESVNVHTPINIGTYGAYSYSPNLFFVSDDDIWVYYSPIQDPGSSSGQSSYYFIVWMNDGYENSTPPDNLLLGNETLPLVTTQQQLLGNSTKSLYCFDIMSSSVVLDAIDLIRVSNSPVQASFLRGKIRSGSSELGSFFLTITNL